MKLKDTSAGLIIQGAPGTIINHPFRMETFGWSSLASHHNL
jgi:hypothetical protein